MSKYAVNESKRTVISDRGIKLSLHGVRSVDPDGSYLRLECEEGYVLVNPDKVFAHVIVGERVR